MSEEIDFISNVAGAKCFNTKLVLLVIRRLQVRLAYKSNVLFLHLKTGI
jgi:hypothetical protein